MLKLDLGDHTDLIQEDFWRLIIGEQLGEGISRTTFASKLDKTKVIKIEIQDEMFQNVAEFQAWESLRYTKWSKWFAPVHYISPMGRILIMDRTTPARHEDIPLKMPSFLSDIHIGNFGLIKGKVVCHDYGFNRFLENGLSATKMVGYKFMDEESECQT